MSTTRQADGGPPRLSKQASLRKLYKIASQRTAQRENDALIGRLRGLLNLQSDDPSLTISAQEAADEVKAQRRRSGEMKRR